MPSCTPSVLDNADIARLGARFRGELIRPGDAGYDAARSVFNAMIDRRPALIARAAGTADVLAAVELSSSRGIAMSVRGGGHNVAGHAVCEGGLMLDLSRLKGIHVDPAARVVRAQPGVTWGEIDHENEALGFFMPGGAVSTTGIAGLTLGGGIGWLSRRFGLVCDNLRAVDIVTMDGRLLTADAARHSELFWGVRGGGGNFGVVTSFAYDLQPVEPILGGALVHPLERGAEVLRFCRALHRSAPDALSVYVAFDRAPDGRPAVIVMPVHVGPVERGTALLAPLRRFGPPTLDRVRVMPYPALQSMLDDRAPWGVCNYWKSSYLGALGDDAIAVVTSFAARAPALSTVMIEHVGGAIGRVPADATAFCHRGVEYNLLVMARWRRPEEADACMRWARELWSAMQPHALDAVYVNYVEPGVEGAARTGAAFGRSYARLAALKQACDPANLLRHNQNVTPAGWVLTPSSTPSA